MGLFNVLEISGSALGAESIRLNVTASNMANANSASSSTNETYRARQPIFRAMFDDFAFEKGASIGVMVDGIVESQAPLRPQYEPNHPMANEEGYVFYSNVNVIEEMANMISASRSYQTNVEVIEAAKQMLQRTLNLGQR